MASANKKTYQETLYSITRRVDELTALEVTTKGRFETIIRGLEVIEAEKKSLPELAKEMESDRNELDKNEKILKEERSNESKLQTKISEEKETKRLLETQVNNIKNSNYTNLVIPDRLDLKDLIKSLSEMNLQLDTKYKEQRDIERVIDDQKKLNYSLNDFIQKGLDIINKQQMTSCPLCEQDYESYTKLAQRVASNTTLSVVLQKYLSDKVTISSAILDLIKEIDLKKASLSKYFEEQIVEVDEKIVNLTSQSTTLLQNIVSLEQVISFIKEKNSQREISLKGLSIEQAEIELNIREEKMLKDREVNRGEISKINDEKTTIAQDLLNINSRIELIDKELNSLEGNKKTAIVTNWFEINFPGQEISLNLLQDEGLKLTGEMESTSSKIKDIEADISVIENEISMYQKSQLEIELAQVKERKEKLEFDLNVYQNFIKEKLSIEIKGLDKYLLSKRIDEIEESLNARRKNSLDMRDEYSKLEKYSENIVAFLQSENSKIDLSKKEKEHQFLYDYVRTEIEGELVKTKNFLQDHIRNFFYEDLINDIYRKIDPHPDFKQVYFKADFDADSPRLDVYVRNKSNTDSKIPNLYFSTAQINILSLSIFLATAMNSEKYDCIFIDDPIQSLDGINILSTVDLLRSVVLNEGKQIILSTHDINFHRILSKKLPCTLFKSKFLELESFGKLKENTENGLIATDSITVAEPKKKESPAADKAVKPKTSTRRKKPGTDETTSGSLSV